MFFPTFLHIYKLENGTYPIGTSYHLINRSANLPLIPLETVRARPDRVVKNVNPPLSSSLDTFTVEFSSNHKISCKLNR